MYPRPYLYDGRNDPTRVRQPECDEQVDVYFVAQTPQLPGRQWRDNTILSWHLSLSDMSAMPVLVTTFTVYDVQMTFQVHFRKQRLHGCPLT